MLSQKEVFDREEVRKIDSSTSISLKNKIVEAYNSANRKIYGYSDITGDTIDVTEQLLNTVRTKRNYFFTIGKKEAVAYYYTDNNSRVVVISAAEDEDAKRNLRTLSSILLSSFFIGNIFVLAVGYFFSKGLLMPVRKITQDVAEISAQNLARRIATGNTRDEWYDLSQTLNELLNRLQESFELQRRFISNASHELSTPLTSISSQMEVALQRERNAEEYQRIMRSVYQDVKHMGKLTQTLLEFAKASGNPGGLEIDLVRVDEILLELPAELAKINASYSVQLQFDDLPEEEEKLLVFGNETLLFTAIKNIVVNACKYSQDHKAFVNLRCDERKLVVEVIDNGSGISATELKNIFQPFYRVEDERTPGGFGLGLSLAERIIKIHKGVIEVDSTVGRGARFIIKLPAAQYLGAV